MADKARNGKRPAVLVGAVLALAVLATVPALTVGAVAGTRPSKVYSLPDLRPVNKTDYRAWIPKRDAADVWSEASSGYASAEVGRNRADNVRAGGFLELEARVRELDGRPVPGVQVKFEWKTKERIQRFVRTTDTRGMASVRRWIGAREKGQLSVIWVSADTPKWSASQYTWYIAE